MRATLEIPDQQLAVSYCAEMEDRCLSGARLVVL